MHTFNDGRWGTELEDVGLQPELADAFADGLLDHFGGARERVTISRKQFKSLIERIGSKVVLGGKEHEIKRTPRGLIVFASSDPANDIAAPASV